MALGGTIWEASKVNEREKNSVSDKLVRKFDILWNAVKKDQDEVVNKERKIREKECTHLKSVIEQRDSELTCLKTEVAELSTQLKTAIDGKFLALTKNDEIQNRAQSIEQKERRIEQEKILLNNQIQTLTEDLNKYKSELQNFQAQKASMENDLKSQLSDKEVELKKAEQKINDTLENNKKIRAEKEDLLSKILTQSQMEDGILENYKVEIQAKTKLNDMYTDLLKEAQDECGKVKNEVEELKVANNVILEKNKSLQDQFDKLKTEHGIFKEKNEQVISLLNSDLEKANKRLHATREENLNLFMEDLTPAASATCNLIKTMSLTQIYSQLIKMSDEINDMTNDKLQLNQKLNRLTKDSNEKNLKFQDLNLKYVNLTENNSLLTKKLEKLTDENEKLQMEKNESMNLYNQVSKENKKLQNDITDLSRQVCFLLQKTQTATDFIITEDLSKPLLTFKDIAELQANNISLIKLVNELKHKLKNNASEKMEIDKESHLVDMYKQKISDLEQERDSNLKIINALTMQKERYEKLNEELSNKNATLETLIKKEKDSVSPLGNDNSSIQLKDALNKLEKQTTDHIKYKNEKAITEKMLSEQLEDIQKQKQDISSKYAKAFSEAKIKGDLLKMANNNIGAFRKQIAGLEERNKIYDSSIMKQEETIRFLRDELLESVSKVNAYEVTLRNLKLESKFLKDSENRLKKERDMLRNERFSQSLLFNDIEFLKVSAEKAKSEKNIHFELAISTVKAECAELKQQIQQQQEQNNEMRASLENKLHQNENALAESEKLVIAKTAQIKSLNEQLQNKNKIVEDLNKRIVNMVNTSSNDKTTEWLLKVKDLEDQLVVYQTQISSLQQELSTSKDEIKKLGDENAIVSENLSKTEKMYSDYKESSEKNIKKAIETEDELRETIDQLKKDISNQSQNIIIPGEREDSNKEFYQNLKDKIAALDKANVQIESLSNAVIASEERYAKEMVLHSNDIQTIIKLKEQLSSLKTVIKGLESEKATFESTISDVKNKFNSREKQLLNDSEDSQSQLVELKKQNSMLHEQLQSQNDDKSKHLLEIVKQLNREKLIFDTKYSAVLIEKNRTRLELEIMEKKINDMKVMLAKSEKINTSINASSAAMPNPEILAKIEMLHALTDSNVLLRQEKDRLFKQVAELTVSCEQIDKNLKEAREGNSETMLKMEVLQTENNNLKTEIGRWRARVNILVEKANKQNPEDWKRLQNERETLAKMLTVEKDNLKRVNEELTTIKAEKITIQEQLNNTTIKLNSLTENFNKQTEEINKLKDSSSKMSVELISAKTSIAEMSETNVKLNATLDAKKVEIEDLSKRETSVRRIAIKYKNEYQELFKTVESKKSDDPDKDTSATSEAEKQILKDQITVYQEKTDNLEKQIEIMRESQDNIEKVKTELSEAQASVARMNEANSNLTAELVESRSRLEKVEEELKSNCQTLQSQYNEEIASIKREKVQVENSKRSAIAQLTMQLESLRQQKIGHSQRSLDESVKPSTSFEQRGGGEDQQVHTNVKSLQSGIATSEISSSPSSSQNVVDLPTSSSNQSCNVASLPPESTQEVVTTPQSATVDNQSQSGPRAEVANTAHQMASSSSSNINNSNSTVTTSHGNNESLNIQRTQKRMRKLIEQVENSSGKRLKIQRAVESELEYQVPTSSQREEDDCTIVADSGDDENQCGNSYQEIVEEMDDDEEKVVQSAQSPENQSAQAKEEATSVASGSTSENNEVEIASPDENQQLDNQKERGIDDSSEVRAGNSSSSHSPNSVQQISSVTGGRNDYLSSSMGTVGSAEVGAAYDEGSDGVVPSMPSTPGELLPGSSQSIDDKATESSEAEAETENTAEIIDEDPMVSSQSSLPTSPNQQIEESSEAVASSTAVTQSPRGHWRRGQGQRFQSTRASEYQLRHARLRSKPKKY